MTLISNSQTCKIRYDRDIAYKSGQSLGTLGFDCCTTPVIKSKVRARLEHVELEHVGSHPKVKLNRFEIRLKFQIVGKTFSITCKQNVKSNKTEQLHFTADISC